MDTLLKIGSKYVYFDKENGRFYLNEEAQKIIYRDKNIICSYSGSNEWCNHYFCELIDLFSGSSKYNYSLGTTVHETEIPKIWKINKESVIKWMENNLEKDWFKRMVESFDKVFDNLPTL